MPAEARRSPADPVAVIAAELSLPARGVAAVVELLADGNTVPFIARYRKEATGGLDEVAIRGIQERREYVRDLEERRRAILSSIDDQGKLTAELRARIEGAATKAELEDLYLPFRPKRRTRATLARERGLEPLAGRILAQPLDGAPRREANRFVDPERGVVDADAALAGARDIAAEVVAETPGVRAEVRRVLSQEGQLCSRVARGKAGERTKFEQYYDHREPVRGIPSHRYLAVSRGEREEVLRVGIEVDDERLCSWIDRQVGVQHRSPFASALGEAIRDGYRRLLLPSVETDVRSQLKKRADREAVDVFAANLRNLLMAAPLGARPVVGIDPGLRTGCKCAAVDATGKYLDHVTIYLTRGDEALSRARRDLAAFLGRHAPAAVAVGNGTGGREAEAFVRRLLADEGSGEAFAVTVNEAGASVYSASDVAREEFPDLDLTIRGAISIARRLQDPLAELVKIEPKAIGVGQYQHDVHQRLLSRKLGEVVESCVNQVGVELGTASAPLLAHVSGVGPSLAKKIVAHRDRRGAFRRRSQLLEVSGLGPKAFEQAAGFLRIRGGDHPLDASAVHPERYELVERMASDLGVDVAALVGDGALVRRIEPRRYTGDGVGEPTLRDILAELEKPGRDPRAEFEPPRFRDDVRTLEDLRAGLVLEGVVTNVTAFGAFVDVGVHQDGLVHVSELADRYVRDPAEVARVGDRITVRVLDVDLDRRRIALSARKRRERDEAPARERRPGGQPRRSGKKRRGGRKERDGRSGEATGSEPSGAGGFGNRPFERLGDLSGRRKK